MTGLGPAIGVFTPVFDGLWGGHDGASDIPAVSL